MVKRFIAALFFVLLFPTVSFSQTKIEIGGTIFWVDQKIENAITAGASSGIQIQQISNLPNRFVMVQKNEIIGYATITNGVIKKLQKIVVGSSNPSVIDTLAAFSAELGKNLSGQTDAQITVENQRVKSGFVETITIFLPKSKMKFVIEVYKDIETSEGGKITTANIFLEGEN